MRNDFCVFILCYKKPDKCKTLKALNKYGYTGDYYLVLSNDDPTINRYIELYGKERCKVFSKDIIEKSFDTMDSFNNRSCVVYARNVCFELAKELGYTYFCELDDDYMEFQFRYPYKQKLKLVYPVNMDEVFEVFIDYYAHNPQITSIAFAQGGDFIGGINSRYNKKVLRKAMNSFICSVDRPFKFNGRINEDVNTYTALANKGALFMTITDIMVNQEDTQQSKAGMTDLYEGVGTYVKSFYTVICSPQAVKISIMGDNSYRIHHNVNWEHTAPKIISGRYKKY